VMIDSLKARHGAARALRAWDAFGLGEGEYGVVTLHRPSNVDDPGVLKALVDTLLAVAKRVPLVFPVHPRTSARLGAIAPWINEPAGNRLFVVPPIGYVTFLGLLTGARFVLTDSGGIQEETTILGVPCLTLRENTERPVTILQGTNRLVGTDGHRVMAGVHDILEGRWQRATLPELWDGHAAERVAEVLERQMAAPTR